MIAAMIVAAMQANPDIVANRFLSLMKTVKSLSVDIKFQSPPFDAPGQGSLAYSKPVSMIFKMKWGPSDYTYSSTTERVLEIERQTGQYVEQYALDRLYEPDSVLTTNPKYSFPLILLGAGFQQITNIPPKFKLEQASKVGEASVDHISAPISGDRTGTMDAYIDSGGRLLKLHLSYTTNVGKIDQDFEFSNYKINQPLPAAVFDTPIPLGFVPFALPRERWPLDSGSPFPADHWFDASTHHLADISSKLASTALVAIVGEDCEPSARSAPTLHQYKSAHPKVNILLVSDSRSGVLPVSLKGYPTYYDPQGKTLDRVNGPGTPLFFLVGKGKVLRVWYGFDPDNQKAFLKELDDATKQISNN